MNLKSAESAKSEVSVEEIRSHFALSALKKHPWFLLGQWPRLLHFAPLALRPGSLDTASESSRKRRSRVRSDCCPLFRQLASGPNLL